MATPTAPPPPAAPATAPAADPVPQKPQVPWKDPRFAPAIDSVRGACGCADADRGDDALIGMLLDRFSWDHAKVVEMYQKSVRKRKDMGMAAIKAELERGSGDLSELPYHAEVRKMIAVNGATSLEKPAQASADGRAETTIVNGKHVNYGNVIGCYELRYGHAQKPSGADGRSSAAEPVDDGSARLSRWSLGSFASAPSSTKSESGGSSQSQKEKGPVLLKGNAAPRLTPEQFTKYMVYVTQWRWLQCERYIHRHGELGFWSMIHDVSCPEGYLSLWGRMRNLLGQYMTPVEEACGGLFPPMVQKILIINVPKIFGPAWAVISRLLPQHHKDRIVLLTTSYTNAAEVGKYVPHQHIPAHLRDGNRPDGPDPPEAPRSTKSEAEPQPSANGSAGAEPSPYPVKPVEVKPVEID